MGYTSVLAVIDRVPALRELSTAQVHIDSGISYATALIEGYLKARFQVPFSDPPPELIAVIAKELAAAYALKNAFSGSVTADQVMEADKMDAAAKGMLRDIVDGKLHLSDAVTKDSIPPRRPPIHVTVSTDASSVRTMDLSGRWGPKRPW